VRTSSHGAAVDSDAEGEKNRVVGRPEVGSSGVYHGRMLRGSKAHVFLDCRLGHAAAKQVYQPSCPRAVTSVPRMAVNGCLYAALSGLSRGMQSGANDARQLVYKWTGASQTIRGGPGVCGERWG
jgi:hypothetical protein